MSEPLQQSDPVSVLYATLSHPRRRYVLHRLREAERSIALADLAEDVAEWEADAPTPEVDAETVQDVYLTLYHNHVPRLEDAGLVEFDAERDAVELAEWPEEWSPATYPDPSAERDDRA